MSGKSGARFIYGGLLISITCLLIWACNLAKSDNVVETFSFDRFADTLSKFDSVRIIAMKPNSTDTLDVLFHGVVKSKADLQDLPAPHVQVGDTAKLIILAYKGGILVYNVEKLYNTADHTTASTKLILVPGVILKINEAGLHLVEGDSALLPSVSITPDSLENKSLIWLSDNPGILTVTPGHFHGIKAGTAHLLAMLKVDSTRKDIISVQVTARELPGKPPDSLRFDRDSLEIFNGGAAESLVVKVYPATANPAVDFTMKDPAFASIAQGKIQGVQVGRTWVIARSQADTSKVDSLLVIIMPSKIVDSVIVKPDSLRLFTGGESQTLSGKTYPDQGSGSVLWRSSKPGIAMVNEFGRVDPISPGTTYVLAISRADSTRMDSARVIVKRDVPILSVGKDTSIAVGQSIVFTLDPPRQDYGLITRFKWDLDGNGVWDDSSADVKPLTKSYTEAKEYAVRFYVRDTEGNDTTVTKKVKVVKGPVVLILLPSDKSYTNKTPIDVSWSVDGVAQSTFLKEALVEGPNTIIRSAPGGVNPDSITVFLDTQAPNKPNVHGPTLTNIRRPTWTWSGGGFGNGTYRYRVDNEALDSATEVKDTSYTPAVELPEGRHTLLVQEKDAAGNWSASGSFAIRIDVTLPIAPKVTILSVSPTNNPKPIWSWTSGGSPDAMGTYRIRLDSSNMNNVTTTVTYQSFSPTDKLAEGSHSLFVQERDSAGNWSASGSVAIQIDLTGPRKPIMSGSIPISPANTPTPQWRWLAGGNGGIEVFRIRIDSSDLSKGVTLVKPYCASITVPRYFCYTPDHNLSEATHILYVQERDSAGNWSDSAFMAVRIDLTRPNAPKLSVSILSPTNNRQPVWSWTSGGNGGMGLYRYHLDNGAWSQDTTALSFKGLSLSEATHTFVVQERDSAYNWSDSSRSVIRVDLTPPKAPLVSTSNGTQTTVSKPTWQWNSGGGGEIIGKFQFYLDDSTGGWTATQSTSFTPSTPMSQGSHSLFIREADSAGNWSPIGSLGIRIYGQIGIATGAGGTILKTINGGGSWDLVGSGTPQNLWGVHFSDSLTGFAVGGGGTILKTTNRGTTWNSISSGVSSTLWAIYFTDALTGYASGDNGTILRTINGGGKWDTLPRVTSNALIDIHFFNPGTGFTVGTNGTILRTSDGGLTWTSINAETNKNFNGVYVSGLNSAYVVGDSGNILKVNIIRPPEGEGEAYQIVHFNGGTTTYLYKVNFVDANNGFVTGFNGTLLKTSNSGSLWKKIDLGGLPYALLKTCFVDGNTGYLIGDMGTILKTENAGETWSAQNGKTTNNLFSISFPK